MIIQGVQNLEIDVYKHCKDLKHWHDWPAGRIWKRWQEAMDVDMMKMQLVKFVGIVMLVSHWLACAFQMIKELEEADYNWVDSYMGG